MREVTVTRDQFNDFLFPALASSSAESESELEVALRVMKKVGDTKITYTDEINETELLAARKEGQKVFPLKRLRDDSVTFFFEEDEHRLVMARVKNYIPRISLLAVEDLSAFIETIKSAQAPDREESPSLEVEN